MRFKFMITAVLLCGLAILIGCQNSAAPLKAEQAKTSTAAPAPIADEHGHTDDAPRITLEEAKKDFDAGNAVFLDTRADVQFQTEHIKGAINMPVETVESRYKEIPTGKKIIAYCS